MSSRFSTGVQLKKRHEFDYSKIAAGGVFSKALEDDDSDSETRKGKINYVALAEKGKDEPATIEFNLGSDSGQEEDQNEDYDAHFDQIQQRRKLVFQGDRGNVGKYLQ